MADGGGPVRKRKPPANAKLYDVGGGELLTTREIAEIVGTSDGTIRGRIKAGWTGSSLVKPLGERKRERRPRYGNQLVACVLAIEFGRRVPSVAEIQEVYPMGESAAYHWMHVYKRAIERTNQRRRR